MSDEVCQHCRKPAKLYLVNGHALCEDCADDEVESALTGAILSRVAPGKALTPTSTYRDLLKVLEKLTESQLSDNVTVEIDGEFHGVRGLKVQQGDDVLHDGHVFLTC